VFQFSVLSISVLQLYDTYLSLFRAFVFLLSLYPYTFNYSKSLSMSMSISWVQDLTAPVHLGLIYWPFVPHV